MKPRVIAIFCFFALLFSAGNLLAGGSGLNVMVVVNQNSTNSVQLGNYYCEQRGVPPQNLLRITNWTGGNVEWNITNFNSVLLSPVLNAITSRGLTNQIDYVLLSMDFPYRVTETNDFNSTTAALFYGFKRSLCPDCSFPGCTLPPNSSSAYFASEGIFRSTPPINAASNSFLVVMLTASNLAQAKLVVDSGVASDGTLPTQSVILGKSDDRLRNIRYWLFDDAIFNTRLRGNYAMQRTNINGLSMPVGVLGYQNGIESFTISSNNFIPGAMADNVSSFSGTIFENIGQTTALAFLAAGASGSYGTVNEPCNYLEKFPSPQNYFYQSRGFSLAECYYQSLKNPLHGLVLGEPLAAPFALPASGAWNNLATNALLTGTTNLTLLFTAHDASRPVSRVDLFVDGRFLKTLTNIPPASGNIVSVTLNGIPTNYTVPANATLKSVTSNLTVKLKSISGSTKVSATAFGDRIELTSQDISKSGSQISLTVSNSLGGAAALTTFIAATGTNFFDTTAFGICSYVLTNDPNAGDFLQMRIIKTNGTTIVTSVTNDFGATNLFQLATALISKMNTNTALQSADGFTIEDVNMHEEEPYRSFIYGTNDHSGEFNIRARNSGWPSSQVKVCISGSPTFTILPSGTNALDENVSDLQSRAHLYITAGVTNLPMTFSLDTSTLADGYHELTAVVYEGSHVQTQKRIAQSVRIQNTALSAAFVSLLGGDNIAVEATMQFSVTANTNSSVISKIELFSTGGLVGTVFGQSNAVFSVPGTSLDLGLHPLYAIVTRTDGSQYRTDTKWIRLVGDTPSFSLALTNPPPVITWPAIGGRSYDVLSATNITDTFRERASVVPTNSSGSWMDTNAVSERQFYRLRVSP